MVLQEANIWAVWLPGSVVFDRIKICGRFPHCYPYNASPCGSTGRTVISLPICRRCSDLRLLLGVLFASNVQFSALYRRVSFPRKQLSLSHHAAQPPLCQIPPLLPISPRFNAILFLSPGFWVTITGGYKFYWWLRMALQVPHHHV
ncbi:hypothetical protein KCP73_06245 [Salmonella enterica subsp. enterica]|nr:hypothetical protein KCP73_06245 [Salmonella enterica subsp. enterica]